MSVGFIGVIGVCSCEYIVNRSRFIATAAETNDEHEAKSFVAEIRKKYSLATHNCYAYVADEEGFVRKFSDDGEPQGTAGMPILEVLRARNFRRTAIAVTRYFGGIKLGVGGLARAYAKAAGDALDKAKTAKFLRAAGYSVKFDYEQYARFRAFNDNYALSVGEPLFEDGVKVDFAVPEEGAEKYTTALVNYFNGKIVPVRGETKYYPFEVE